MHNKLLDDNFDLIEIIETKILWYKRFEIKNFKTREKAKMMVLMVYDVNRDSF